MAGLNVLHDLVSIRVNPRNPWFLFLPVRRNSFDLKIVARGQEIQTFSAGLETMVRQVLRR